MIDASQPVDPYWILVEGLGECSRARQVGVLLYHGSATSQPTLPPWSVLLGFGLDPGYVRHLSPFNEEIVS